MQEVAAATHAFRPYLLFSQRYLSDTRKDETQVWFIQEALKTYVLIVEQGLPELTHLLRPQTKAAM
ncbi:MAG: hypothetical protein QXI12_12545 [Candidatus Methanomethyliaceae archaeon]